MNYNFIRSHRASQILKDFLRSNGINHHWLIPRNICPIVLKVFKTLSIKYSLIDIYKNGLINLDKIENNNVDYGLLFVEAYGEKVNSNNLFKEFKINNPGSIIIKDKCLSIPEKLVNINFDNYSDLILYSTGYSKFLDLKEGGYAFYNKKFNIKQFLDFDSDFETFKDRYNNYLLKKKWDEISMEEIQYLTNEEQNKKKIINNKILNILIKNNIKSNLISKVWRYTILTNNMKVLEKVLNENKILFGHNYPCMLHLEINIEDCQACNHEKKIINIFNDFRFNQNAK